MLFTIGVVIALVGNIWYIIAAFQVTVWWGLGVLFIPLVELIFLFAHWPNAKRPFLVSLVGSLIAYGGIFIIPDFFEALH